MIIGDESVYSFSIENGSIIRVQATMTIRLEIASRLLAGYYSSPLAKETCMRPEDALMEADKLETKERR